MQRLIKNLLKNSILLIAIAIVIIITYLSLVKLEAQPISISHLDKLEHAIAYFFLTLSWLLVIRKKSQKNITKIIVVFSCVFFGILIEILQGTLTNYREASYLDILANSFGVFMAMLFFNMKIEKKTTI